MAKKQTKSQVIGKQNKLGQAINTGTVDRNKINPEKTNTVEIWLDNIITHDKLTIYFAEDEQMKVSFKEYLCV